MWLKVLYLAVAGITCIVVGATIVKVRTVRGYGFVLACSIGGFVAILSMIKLRCTIDSHPCGFMSFNGGVTWHLAPGLVAFVMGYMVLALWLNRRYRVGFGYWVKQLGHSLAPLLGLSLAVVWEVLPVGVIHPPSHGGVCPNLPVICHDIALMGRGGLLYWAAPFVVWAGATFFWDVRELRPSLRKWQS